MVILIKVYLLMFLIAFITTSLVVLCGEGVLKEALIISSLNIVWFMALVSYRTLYKLGKMNAKRLLGRPIKYVSDYTELGLSSGNDRSSLKNIIKMIFLREIKGEANNGQKEN